MEKSSFFNAVIDKEGVPDRSYLAEDFAKYFSTFIGNGVFPNPSTQLQVVAIDNNNMQIRIKNGFAWINGYMYQNTDDYILTLDPADGVLDRIDRIVLRLDFLERVIKALVKKGNWSSSAVPKELQRDSDAYEIALADIKVSKGAISISQQDITDLRLNKALCGIVHGVVDQVDTTAIFNQFEAWYSERQAFYKKDVEEWTQAKKEEFEKWSTDTKGKHQTWVNNKESEYQAWTDAKVKAFEIWYAEKTDNFIKEWSNWYSEHTSEWESSWSEWFKKAIDWELDYKNWLKNIKEALDGNVAGNLLNRIESTQTSFEELKENLNQRYENDKKVLKKDLSNTQESINKSLQEGRQEIRDGLNIIMDSKTSQRYKWGVEDGKIFIEGVD